MDAQARRQQVVGLALLTLGACSSTPPAAAPSAGTTTTTASSKEVLPFIHDDYPRALAEAKKAQKPLFVDAWAPWCHSCMSLKTYVLTDPSLAPLAKDFVWLSVDTEKEANAAWVQKYPHDALPTLWIVDPATETPLLKWAGTATAPELKALLTASISNDPSMAAFIRGNHALAAGDTKLALKEHEAALDAAKPGSENYPRVAEAMVTELSLSKDNDGCAQLASIVAPVMPPGTSRASVLVAGLGCAREAKNAKARDALLALAEHDATERDASILPDDRSAIYEELVATSKDLGNEASAKKIAQDWATYLEAEAKKAATKDARTALDPWRVAAYIATGEPAKALPVLEESARDFPQDYNPHARLGRVYLVLGRVDEAAKSADRAIALVYGPRAMRVYELRADIAKAKGDKAAEIRALEEALAKSEHANLTQGQRGVREKLVKRLAALR
jgi:thioredoxin-like negative regulator of GroEL/predicted negative regulator of RcsB-dependent stress response